MNDTAVKMGVQLHLRGADVEVLQGCMVPVLTPEDPLPLFL